MALVQASRFDASRRTVGLAPPRNSVDVVAADWAVVCTLVVDARRVVDGGGPTGAELQKS